MRDHYDFSKGTRNPYAKFFKSQVTMRLDRAVINHFKKIADEMGIRYQTLINLYLRDCVAKDRTLKLDWDAKEIRTAKKQRSSVKRKKSA